VADSLPDDDVEPPVASDDSRLAKLIAQAEQLIGQAGDPKAEATDRPPRPVDQRRVQPRGLLPLHRHGPLPRPPLQGRFEGVTIEVVTGELTSEERKEKVDLLGDAEHRLLIATDCLSEASTCSSTWMPLFTTTCPGTRPGTNSGKAGSTASGSLARVVRATLIYGANNPVDGAVLEVILRKAAKIREELGVPVRCRTTATP